jgi:hypothetical protein
MPSARAPWCSAALSAGRMSSRRSTPSSHPGTTRAGSHQRSPRNVFNRTWPSTTQVVPAHVLEPDSWRIGSCGKREHLRPDRCEPREWASCPHEEMARPCRCRGCRDRGHTRAESRPATSGLVRTCDRRLRHRVRVFARCLQLGIRIGVAYGIRWAVGVAITASIASAVFDDEALTFVTGLAIGLVVAGVLTVELGSRRGRDRGSRSG